MHNVVYSVSATMGYHKTMLLAEPSHPTSETFTCATPIY